jgi:hypothetical protein
MNATPPEANTEYSRLRGALFASSALAALLLLVAEFTPLFEVRTAGSAGVRAVGSGSHHGYALVPIALLGVAFGYAVWAAASRPALLGLGTLGVIALLIGLIGDLPDASASGIVLSASHYVEARSSPSAGFYMETLGAVLLIITSASGLLLAASPSRDRKRSRPPAPTAPRANAS